MNEPATVTIEGKAAAVSGANVLTGGLPVVPGTNVFTIRATDTSGNSATASYGVDVTDAPKSFTYEWVTGDRRVRWVQPGSAEIDSGCGEIVETVGPHRAPLQNH